MKLKNHLFDLIRVRILSWLGHRPQLFRDVDTVIETGHVYRAYGYLLKVEPLSEADRALISEARSHPESATVTTSEGFSITPPDPRCSLCPLFIQGIPCREEAYNCENVKYVIIKKPARHGE